MRRMYLFGIMAPALLALVFVAGCDKDDPAGPNEKEIGSLNDPSFQQAAGAFEMADAYAGYSLEGILDQMDEIDGISGSPQLGSFRSTLTRPAADSFYATYNGTTEYWTVYMRIADSGMTFEYTDSVQFRADDNVLQWPDSTVDEVRAGGALSVTEAGTNNTITAGQVWSLAGDIVNEGDVTVNGTGLLTLDVTDGDDVTTCTFDLDFVSTWVNVTADLSAIDLDVCPTAGTITHEGEVDLSCTNGDQSLTIADTWMARVTFSGTDVSAVWENSTHRWTYTGPCDELP